MKPVLLARFNGCIYTRIVYPDFIIHNIGSEPIIALFIGLDVCDSNYNKQIVFVIPSDIVKSHVGTYHMRVGVLRRELIISGVSTRQLARECYNRLVGVGSAWTIVAGIDVDKLLWRLLEVINGELFFI